MDKLIPFDFIRTLYLGDRACKNILLDGWGERVVIQVSDISRVRSASGNWEFYTDEDIVDGYIVCSLKSDYPFLKIR